MYIKKCKLKFLILKFDFLEKIFTNENENNDINELNVIIKMKIVIIKKDEEEDFEKKLIKIKIVMLIIMKMKKMTNRE